MPGLEPETECTLQNESTPVLYPAGEAPPVGFCTLHRNIFQWFAVAICGSIFSAAGLSKRLLI